LICLPEYSVAGLLTTYRATETSLGFEGDMALAEEMA
jgi:hypothetical protein